MIRKATTKDTCDITNIYNYYILNSAATFEENSISINFFEDKIQLCNGKISLASLYI